MVRTKILISFLIITASFLVFSNLDYVSALTYSSDVGQTFTFAPALQINVSADLVISNLSPGTASDSNIIDVAVLTNNATGYTLNATVGDNTNYNTRNLIHEVDGSSAIFSSINFGSSLSSLSADNTWGYSYSTNNGTNWSNYDGLPLYDDTTNIATLKTSNNQVATATGDIVKFKIAARAAVDQYSGEYNNVINFIAIANPVPTIGPVTCASGKICYNANVADVTEVDGTMGQQTASTNASVDLLASNFSRSGYGFAGWSDSYDYAYNTNVQLYGPQETITTPSDMSGGLALYAIWIPSAGSLQNDAVTVCRDLIPAANGFKTLNSVSALTDERDDETYAVARLADGNCWMIENLRLESTAAHNSDGTLAQGYGTSATYGNFSGLADAETTTISSTTPVAANSLYYSGTQSGTASIDIGTTDNPQNRMPRYNNNNTQNRPSNPTANTISDDATTGGMYSFGNYYTWHAVIADTTYYDSGDHDTTSICPAGWRIPKGGNRDTETTNDVWNLVVNNINDGVRPQNYSSQSAPFYNGTTESSPIANKMRAYPNNFIYSGMYSAALGRNRGAHGYIWTASAISNTHARGFSFSNSHIEPGGTGYTQATAMAIRCMVDIQHPVATEANKISYNPNASGVEGTMGLQSISSSDTSATLLASNFSREGYGFAGWSDNAVYASGSNFYGPNEDITFTAGQYASQGLSLYAIWVKSAGSMQSDAASVCNSLTAATNGLKSLASVSALTDQRDGQTYAIAKLADGKCWMIENLRLDNTASLSSGTHSPSLPLTNEYGGTTSNYLSATSSSWCTDNTAACHDQSRLNTINTASRSSSVSSANNNIYSYGNYYNWYSATGGHGLHSVNTNNTNVSGDICPSSWRLPKGGDDTVSSQNDYYNLAYNSIGSAPNDTWQTNRSRYYNISGTQGTTASKVLRSFPIDYTYSGYYMENATGYRGQYGLYWTSTTSDEKEVYRLYIDANYVGPATDSNPKHVGRMVRCLVGT